jgi:transcriptional regulator with XRE-family HTH domain
MEKPSWPNTIFGDQLRQLRKAANITQEELAFRAGLARTYISLLERGIKSPSLTIFLRLCIVLQRKPEEVIAQIHQRLLLEEKEGLGSLLPSGTKENQGASFPFRSNGPDVSQRD